MMPLYEAKMLHHFDHRWATYDPADSTHGHPVARDVRMAEKQDAQFVVMPRYWVPADEVHQQLAGRWDHQWLMGWREVARSTDERTVISSISPLVGVGHKQPLLFASSDGTWLLLVGLSSFALDFTARQKAGGTAMSYFIVKQLPVPATRAAFESLPVAGPSSWCAARLLELSYTAWDMAGLARSLGDVGAPFVWDDNRRSWMRAELDAAAFHLYGVTRDDLDYIMETFPIVRRKDEASHGYYRTKERILQIYDALAEADRTGVPYKTALVPPPGQGLRHSTQKSGARHD